MTSKKTPEDSNPLSELDNEHTQADEFDPLIGKRVQKYAIVSRVARGGTATVYRADDTVLNREVAFKILHEHLESRREVVERFRNEAKVVASLRHPNIVNIYDFLEFDGRAVLVAEFMPGETLSQLIKKYRRIPENQVLMLGHEILQGLKAAHDKGVTHRDIKPANILIHPELGVKISDFGLAKLVHADDGLTKEGIFIGTPSFSSPEQIEGKPVDHRTDIFSLGLCLYMMASGSHAFKQKGDTTTTVWFKIVRGNFQGVREISPDLSVDLERILDRALEVKPDKRYQTAREMMTDIQTALKRRRLYPYNEALGDFLRNPYGAKKASTKVYAVKKWAKLSAAGALLAAVLIAGSLFMPRWLETQKDTEESAPVELPADVPTAPTEEVAPPVEPKVAPPAPKPKVPERKSAPVQAQKGMQSSTALKVPTQAALVSPVSERAFALRFTWKEGEDFFLSTRPSYEPSLVRGKYSDQGYDWSSWDEGKYYWKGGDTRGEILIESLDTYRQRHRVEKRELSVSSQYSEVDLQINPWMQQIRLAWESGPDADIYRLEVARDPSFKEIIFSGTPATKWERIERLWEEDQSIYWRVSYMDANQNVFFKEPVRQINLKLNVSAPHFEILEPRAYQKVGDELAIRAIGPRQSKLKCSLVEKGQPIGEWKSLNANKSGFFTIKLPAAGTDLLCDGEKEGAHTFLFVPLES